MDRETCLDLIWALVAGCVATLLGGYVFGEGNQWAHLVQVYRHIDPAYLPGDWFADTTQEESVRRYYTMIMSGLVRVFPVAPTFLTLTVLANTGIALVTVRASRALFSVAGAEARWAAALAVGVAAFGAGGATHLSRHFFEPALAARVFALAMVLAVWRSRPLLAIVAGAVAIALQPLVGVETVALATLSLCVAAVWLVELRRRAAIALAVGAVLAGWTLLLWADMAARQSPAAELTTILAKVRAPHHYLPSTFDPAAIAALLVFLAAACIAWAAAGGAPARVQSRAIAAAAMAGVVLACLAGWLFVELIPIRSVLTAQTFRLTYLLKWVGFLLIAANAGRWWRLSRSTSSSVALRAAAALSVLSFGKFYAVGALLGQSLGFVAERHPSRLSGSILPIAMTAGAAALMATPYGVRPGEPLVAWLLIATTLLPASTTPRRARWVMSVYGLLLVLTLGALAGRREPAAIAVADRLSLRLPVVTLAEGDGDLEGLQQWARDSTSPDDVFIVPPDLGRFRLRAERPIVVDFKGVAFSGAQLVNWYERMRACCLAPLFEGPGSIGDFRTGYRLIDDERLEMLGIRYGARYAVLPHDTDTRMPVRYVDARFKVVCVSPLECPS